MTLGAYTITTAGSNTTSGWVGYTVCERGSFSKDVVLRSVVVTVGSSTGGTARPVVYANGTLVASGGTVPISGTSGTQLELPLSPAPTLTAGVVYDIGFYNSGPGGLQNYTAASQDVHASVPSYCDWSEYDTNEYYAFGNSAPTTGQGGEIKAQFTFDTPVPPSNVSYFDGTSWHLANRSAYDGSAWKQHTTTVF